MNFRKSLLVLIFAIVSQFAFAQIAPEPAWLTNLNQAIELSNKTKKPIMLFFTGSDWCGWCKRLQAEVFHKPEFSDWASKNVILVEVDFPRRTPLAPELQSQNSQLQQFFQVQGYPTIWFVNAKMLNGQINFEKIGSTGYVFGGPAAWLDAANQIIAKK
jgi:protein disulfide-isomerase